MKTIIENTSFAGKGLDQLIHLISLPEAKEENTQGIFKGKVVSAKTGARVFGVVVELVGTRHSYITSPTGYFKMTDVPEGIYLARFSFPGFKEVTEVIAILNGESLDLTLSLEVGED
ncbi:MAG: carboxypeptidase-like regulatory domain-containing protein [Flavobacteriales bacterium]|nr:carboxypeptidase-like regulatory domain-containing protein [Flavobacteriales bacterium]